MKDLIATSNLDDVLIPEALERTRRSLQLKTGLYLLFWVDGLGSIGCKFWILCKIQGSGSSRRFRGANLFKQKLNRGLDPDETSSTEAYKTRTQVLGEISTPKPNPSTSQTPRRFTLNP